MALLPPSALTPGASVDTRRAGIATTGIYLGRALTSTTLGTGPSPVNYSSRDHLVLSLSGSVVPVLAEDVTFACPFAPAELASTVLASVGTTPPGVGHSVPSANELWQLLRLLTLALEQRSKVLVARGAKQLYDMLQSSHSRQTLRSVTTDHALGLLFRPSAEEATSPLDGPALHAILMSLPDQFTADPVAHRTSAQWTVRSQAELAELSTIRNWIRGSGAGSKELDGFVKEAVAAINFGLAHAPTEPASSATPATPATPATGLRWSAPSVRLLNFLLLGATSSSRTIQTNPYTAVTSAILKAIDAELNPNLATEGGVLTSTDLAGGKPGPVGTVAAESAENQMNKERLLAFLSAVGAVAPWEDWVAWEVTDLRGWDKHDAKDEPASSPTSSPSSPAAFPSGLTFDDPHDPIRHDFSFLPVYTIDDPTAVELDDGLSIEPVLNEPTEHWIHAHIADPTSIPSLSPHSPLALLAQHRNQTEYFPEKTWGMLPEQFIVDNKLSLGSAGPGGGGQRTVSISARVTDQGEVLESKIRVGLVRNVLQLTYGAVDGLLGHARPATKSALVHGPALTRGERACRPTDDAQLRANPAAHRDLTILHKLATALLAKRAADGALYWNVPRASPSLTGTGMGEQRWEVPESPTFPAAGPRIELPVDLDACTFLTSASAGPASTLSPAQVLVSELMVLANRSAAKFFAERSIPIPYVSQSQPEATSAQLTALLAVRNPVTGEARAGDVLKAGVEFASSALSLSPGPHWPMGIRADSGYVRVTSPLRRWGDLVGHWQIKRHLLDQAGRANGGPTGGAFGEAAMRLMIGQMAETSLRRGKAGNRANAFWAAYLLRAKHSAFLSRIGAPSPYPAFAPPPGSSGRPSQDDELAERVFRGATALALRAPTHSIGDGRWQQSVLIPEVGLVGQLWLPSLAAGLGVGESAAVEVVRVVCGGMGGRLVVQRRKGE